MRFESYVVTEILQRMEQQNAALRPQVVQIATALSKDAYAAARDASAELHRVLDTFVATTEILHEHIAAHDGLGAPESIGELMLRARTMVLVSQLASLGEELKGPVLQARIHDWFAGSIRRFADLLAFAEDRATTAHALWKPYRRDQPQQVGMTEADRAIVYRTMVRVAERALGALPKATEVSTFLNNGIAATDLPDVQLACKQIAAVLGHPISVEPARHLRRPHRASASGSVAEER